MISNQFIEFFGGEQFCFITFVRISYDLARKLTFYNKIKKFFLIKK